MLLVAFHVVGFDAESGLRIREGLYRDLSDVLAYVRMPLFTFLSGIVYAYRPFTGDWRGFTTGKVRRLLVPLVIVGFPFEYVRAHTEAANAFGAPWYMMLVTPLSHFWYVEALFLIFVGVMILEASGALATKKRFLIVLSVAVAIYLARIMIPHFAIWGASYLFPYFLLGLAMQRYSLIEHLNLRIALALGLGVAMVLIMIVFDALPLVPKRSVLGLLLGSLSCVALLSIKAKPKLLGSIGGYSYTIYLYHVFFTAAARIALGHLGIVDTDLLFVGSLTAGIVGPILIDHLCSATNTTRAAFLGKSPTEVSKLWLTRRYYLLRDSRPD